MQSSGGNNLEILKHDLDALMKWRTIPHQETVDTGYLDLCRKFNARYLNYRMPLFEERKFAPFTPKVDSDKSLLLFSGGKVSLATALWLKEMGKDIELLYFYDKEYKAVLDLMGVKQLGIPYTARYTKIPDNEFAGMHMVHYALEFALEKHLKPSIYMGYFEFALMDNNPKRNWRYSKDFIEAYANVAKKYIEGVEVLGVLPNYAVVDDILSKYNYEAVQ